jgi:hypothetical protein
LIASNANGTASSTIVSPNAANVACSDSPAATPNIEKYPARRPCANVREIRYSHTGPGVAASTSDANVKSARRSVVKPSIY